MLKTTRTQQMLVMTVVWGLALIAYDLMFNKHLRKPSAEAVKAQRPQLRMRINHLCCSGCQDVAFQALKTLPWLGEPAVVDREKLIEQAEAAEAAPPSSYSGTVVVDIKEVNQVDFVALYAALQKASLVAGELEVGGLAHYSLRASVDHLCCKLCVTAAQEAMEPKQDPKFGATLQWMDSANVSQTNKTITAFARFGKTADVAEFFRVLDQAGFAPQSMRLVPGDD